MVIVIAVSGIVSGLLAAGLAVATGTSFLGVLLAYCLTGAVAATLFVAAAALRPTSDFLEPQIETQSV